MVLIVPAKPDDAPAIAAVHVAAWRETYGGIVPQVVLDGLSEVQRTAQWRRILDSPGIVLVARDGGRRGRIVGFVQAMPLRDPDAERGDGEIGGLYLLREKQGRGIGRALAAAGVRWLALEGMRRLFIWVLADNRPARGFYKRLAAFPIVPSMKPSAASGCARCAIAGTACRVSDRTNVFSPAGR